MRIKRMSESATVPRRTTEGSAGYDLYADITDTIAIAPMDTAMLSCGFAFEIPEGLVGLVFPRSGISTKEGLVLANGVAVIDSDFRGEVKMPIRNLSTETRYIHPQQRVAQMVIMPYYCSELVLVTELTDTDRGTGGFGHTGR